MKKHMKLVSTLLLICCTTYTVNGEKILRQTVHVFGDSHASYLFSVEHQGKIYCERSFYKINIDNQTLLLPFVINWLGPITMHRIGRDGISCPEVKENDIVVFVTGEIDVRCHIGRQRDLVKRSLDEVIETLVNNYINFILNLKNKFNNLTCVISMVVPPTNITYNPTVPYYGTLEDRIFITKQLNETLKNTATANDILFIDNYCDYCTPKGDLRLDINEPNNVHVVKSWPTKQRLLELIASKLEV